MTGVTTSEQTLSDKMRLVAGVADQLNALYVAGKLSPQDVSNRIAEQYAMHFPKLEPADPSGG